MVARRTNSDRNPVGIVEQKSKGSTAAGAERVSKMLGWISIELRIAGKLRSDVSLCLTVPVFTALQKGHFGLRMLELKWAESPRIRTFTSPGPAS